MVAFGRWSALALLLLAPKLWAETLTVQFPATPMQVGRSIRVAVSTPRPHPSLASLDLSPWAPWLVLDQRGDVQPNRGGGQTLVVWLVPRVSAAGRVQLPPLSLGPLHGGGQAITIAPARELKGGEAIGVRFSAPPGTAWLRQQLIYTVSVVSRHRYLQFSPQPGGQDGIVSLAIPQQVTAIGSGDKRLYRHTTGWLLFPSQAGRHELQLPAVGYSIDGVTTHRFYPPPLALQVRPLPDYLPPTVAVGRVDLQGERRPWGLVRSGDLQTRRFVVVTHGVLNRWWHPPPVVAGDNGVQLYEAAPALQRHIDSHGLTLSYRYRLPLSVSGAGWHYLNGASRLYAFDPLNGKMQALDMRVELPLSLYGWQEWGLGVMLLAALWFGGRWLWWRLRRRYRWAQGYRRALASLRTARDLDTLRQALTLVARAEGWPSNLSLGQWHRHWRALQPKAPMEAWVRALAAGLYGTEPGRPDELANGLDRALRTRLRWWRWLAGPGRGPV